MKESSFPWRSKEVSLGQIAMKTALKCCSHMLPYPARGVTSNESTRLLRFPEDIDEELKVFTRAAGNHRHRMNLSYVMIKATQLAMIVKKLVRHQYAILADVLLRLVWTGAGQAPKCQKMTCNTATSVRVRVCTYVCVFVCVCVCVCVFTLDRSVQACT